MGDPPHSLAGFDLTPAPADARWPWPVYRRGAGPSVVLLHELFGLTDDLLRLAGRMCESGFTVWLPVLSGPVPAGPGDERRTLVQVCISREFNVLRWGKTSRVVTPLRALVSHIGQVSSSGSASVDVEAGPAAARVGVVGMCFSGGFALALAARAPVLAAVAAQPSIPYPTPLTPWSAKDLGLSGHDVAGLAQRLGSGDLEIYYTRFSADRSSPPEREAALVERCGARGIVMDTIPSGVGSAYGIGPDAHSTLALAPTRYTDGAAAERLDQTLRDVLKFLHRRLD